MSLLTSNIDSIFTKTRPNLTGFMYWAANMIPINVPIRQVLRQISNLITGW